MSFRPLSLLLRSKSASCSADDFTSWILSYEFKSSRQAVGSRAIPDSRFWVLFNLSISSRRLLSYFSIPWIVRSLRQIDIWDSLSLVSWTSSYCSQVWRWLYASYSKSSKSFWMRVIFLVASLHSRSASNFYYLSSSIFLCISISRFSMRSMSASLQLSLIWSDWLRSSTPSSLACFNASIWRS